MDILDHQFQWPTIPQPDEIPADSGLSRRRDFRLKQLLALFLVSRGFSVAVEMYTLMADFLRTDIRASSVRAAIPSLVDIGILHTKNLTMHHSGPVPLTVVHPTKKGRKLCHAFGWGAYETEWERMRRLHEKGKSEPDHTCATLAFAYQARLRGYRAGVIPVPDTPGQFAPDAIVFEDDEPIWVEVELRYGKVDKWANLRDHQGFAAICTNTAKHRSTLKQECQDINVPGRVTDLKTLFMTSKDVSPCPLWLDQWD
jgi:hypothetical protein